jgi:hypothetical protein
MDSTALRTALAAANVTVLTSSTGAEVSFENPDWQHGAFTKVLLDAFDDPVVDINKNGLITPNGLATFVASRVHAYRRQAASGTGNIIFLAGVGARCPGDRSRLQGGSSGRLWVWGGVLNSRGLISPLVEKGRPRFTMSHQNFSRIS